MRKILIIVITLSALSGCTNPSIDTQRLGKDDAFEVEYLFEKDGVKVYRFWDAGHFHYFTSNGETMSTKYTGKTDYQENIKQQDK